MNAIIWGVRFFVKTTFQVIIVDSFYGISQTLSIIPFETLSYDKANKSNIVKFTIFREISIHIGKVILFLVMTLISTLSISFLFGGGASLLYLFF